jgi:hypothetical protein
MAVLTSLHQIFSHVHEANSFVSACTLVWVAVIYLLVFLLILVLIRLGNLVLPTTSDPAYLLLILRTLGITPSLPVYISESSRKRYPDAWGLLETHGVISLQDSVDGCEFACVDLDTHADSKDLDKGLKGGSKLVLYSRQDFLALLPKLSDDMKGSLIDCQGVPSEEQIMLQLLLAVLRCPENGLCSGRGNLMGWAADECASTRGASNRFSQLQGFVLRNAGVVYPLSVYGMFLFVAKAFGLYAQAPLRDWAAAALVFAVTISPNLPRTYFRRMEGRSTLGEWGSQWGHSGQ